MRGSEIENLAESELAIFEEIIKCPQCISGENICQSHASAVKAILMKEAKMEIERLVVK